MTQQTQEQDAPEVGYYVIGVFDILGQSRKLLQPTSFPLTTADEEQRVVRNLTEAVAAVDRFRNLFQLSFHERQRAFEQYASEVPEPERAAFRSALASRILGWRMSDTYVVAIPLQAGSGATGAMAAMADVRRSLEVAVAAWLLSLAAGDPIRGGMEIGTAAKMGENEVYGAALVHAYRLESKVAGGARIVVGQQLLETLQGASQDPDVNFRGAARFATDCCSMLRERS